MKFATLSYICFFILCCNAALGHKDGSTDYDSNNVVVTTNDNGRNVIRFFLDADNVYSPSTEKQDWWYTVNDHRIPFKTIQLQYNPRGHVGGLSLKDAEYAAQLNGQQEAAEFSANHSSWRIAHFDLHYYVWPKSRVTQIDNKNTLPADAAYLPVNYSCPLQSFEPHMGLHCIDTTKDYSTLDFTRAPENIYGSYDGKVNFLETMFSNQFLETVVRNGAYSVNIPQPRQYYPFEPFPTTFRFRYNEKVNAFVIVMVF